jgi:hypothetical protein
MCPRIRQLRLLGTKTTTTTQIAKMRAALEKRFNIIRPPFSCEGDSAQGVIGGKFLANDLASNARRPIGTLLGKSDPPRVVMARLHRLERYSGIPQATIGNRVHLAVKAGAIRIPRRWRPCR